MFDAGLSALHTNRCVRSLPPRLALGRVRLADTMSTALPPARPDGAVRGSGAWAMGPSKQTHDDASPADYGAVAGEEYEAIIVYRKCRVGIANDE